MSALAGIRNQLIDRACNSHRQNNGAMSLTIRGDGIFAQQFVLWVTVCVMSAIRYFAGGGDVGVINDRRRNAIMSRDDNSPSWRMTNNDNAVCLA